MSKEIDTRVVEMQFNNSQFESNAKTTLGTLDKLKNALNFSNKSSEVTHSLTNIQKSVNNVDFSPFSNAIDSVQNRLSTLGIIGATVINNITTGVITSAKQILTAIPRQISEGGLARALNIEQAKFMLEGLDVSWNDIQEDINYGVKDTAYGLDAAAKAASQLVASGVEFGATYGETGNSPMAKALRGISGVAAMTNSSYEEISSIFTTVAGQGKLMTMQLRQMEARGLNAAAQMGKVMGKTEEQIRDMVTKGQIDFKTFSEAMDDAFGAQAKKANETYTGALSNVKAALSRIGAELKASRIENLRKIFVTAIPVINNFKAQFMPLIEYVNKLSTIVSKKLIKALQYFDPEKNAAINDSLKQVVDTSVYLLKTIKSGVGSTGKIIWNFFKNTVNPFWGLVKEIGSLIGDIVSSAFKGLKEGIGNSGLDVLEKILSSITTLIQALNYGVFYLRDSVLDSNVTRIFERIGSIIKALAPIANKLFNILIDGLGKVGTVSYRVHSLFSSAFDYLDLVFNAIANGSHQLTPFFDGLIVVGKNVLQVVKFVAGLLVKDIGPFLDKLKDKAVFNVIKVIYSTLRKIGNYLIGLDGFGTKISRIILQLYGRVKLSLTSTDGLLSGIIKLIKSVISWLWKLKDGVQYVEKPVEYIKNALKSLKPIIGAIKDAFGDVFDSIKTGFAGAFGDLGEKLKSGGPGSWYFGILNFFTAISALLSTGIITRFAKVSGQLFDTLQNGKFTLGRFEGTLKTIRQPFINLKYVLVGYQKELEAIRLMKIAGAIAIIATSMLLLSTIDDQELERAATGLTVIVTALVTATKMIGGMDFTSFGSLINNPIGRATTAMIKIAAAVILMSIAVKSLSKLDDKELGKGLVAISAILGIFAGFFKVLNTNIIGTTAPRIAEIAGALVTFAIALNLLVIPVKSLGGMDFSSLAQGLGAIVALFAIFAGLFKVLNTKIIGTTAPRIAEIASALVTFAIALNLLVIPVKTLGNMDPDSLGKGLGSVTLLLIELVAAIAVLNTLEVPGGKLAATAASLLLLAIALGNLAIVVKLFGSMKISTLVIGLISIAAVLGTLVGIAYLAQTTLTGLAALSGVLIAFGIAAAGVGAGLFLIATGLAALVGIGVGGVSILVTQLGLLMTLIPVFFQQLALGIATFFQVLASCGDAIIQFVATIITSLAKGINQALPEIGKLIGNILDFVIKCITDFGPKINTIVLNLLDFLLDIAYDFLPKFNTFIFDAVVSVLDAIDTNLPRIVDKAFTIVVTFINSMADALDKHGEEIWEAIYNLLMSILDFLGLKVRDFIEAAEKWIEGVREGIHNKINDAIQAVADVVTAIGEWFTQQWETFKSWGSNIVQGLKEGLENAPIIGSVISFAKKIKSTFTGEMEINSPSKVFYRYGVYLTKGLIKGLKDSETELKSFIKGWITILDFEKMGLDKVTGISLLKFSKSTNKYVTKQVDEVLNGVIKNMDYGRKTMETIVKKHASFLGVHKDETKQILRLIDENVLKVGDSSKNMISMLVSFSKETIERTTTPMEVVRNSVANLSKELYKSSDAYKESLDNVKLYTKSLAQNKKTLKENKQKIKDNKEELKELEKTEKSLEKKKDKASKKRLKKVKQEIKELKNENKKLKDSNKELFDSSKSLTKALEEEFKLIAKGPKKALKEYKQTIKETVKSSLDLLSAEVTNYSNLFEKMEEVEEISVNNLLYNMHSQIQGIAEWKEDLDKLSKTGIADGLLNKLKDMGPEGAQYVKAFLKMTKHELEMANTMFKAEGELTSMTLIDNMQRQLDAAKTWTNNITKLANSGLHYDLLKQLEEVGPENAEYVQALADMNELQIAKINEMYKETQTLSAKAADSALAALSISLYKTQNPPMLAGLDDGVHENLTKALSYQVREDVENAMEEVVEAEETMDAAQNAGYAIGAGISVGIKNATKDIQEASKIIGESAVKQFNTYFSTDNGSQVAIQITNGLVSGLGTGAESVAEAARMLAIQAYDAMKDELGIHSPSKRMEEIGRYSDMGLARGLLKYTSFVTASASTLGTEAYDALKETMSVLCNSVMDEIDQPVIKPTLDLTDINNKAGRINDLFESGKIVPSGNGIDGIQNGSNIQFVQNNYSPKALSRIDIYRQTRNQISVLKGVSRP